MFNISPVVFISFWDVKNVIITQIIKASFIRSQKHWQSVMVSKGLIVLRGFNVSWGLISPSLPFSSIMMQQHATYRYLLTILCTSVVHFASSRPHFLSFIIKQNKLFIVKATLFVVLHHWLHPPSNGHPMRSHPPRNVTSYGHHHLLLSNSLFQMLFHVMLNKIIRFKLQILFLI